MQLIASILAGLALARITVTVNGPQSEYCGWPMVEISRWLHQKAPGSIWPYIDEVADGADKLKGSEALVVENHLEKVKGLSNNQAMFLKSSMESRSMSHLAGVYEDIINRVGFPSDEGCRSWVSIGKLKVCKVPELEEALEKLSKGSIKSNEIVLTDFDLYQSLDASRFPAVILWADPADASSWAPLHRSLVNWAEAGDVTYVLRFVIRRNGCDLAGKTQIPMTGFGASFEVKEAASKSDLAGLDLGELGVTKNDLEIVSSLDQEDLLDLGVKTTQLIVEAIEPVTAFKSITGNFPLLAKSIAKNTKVDSALGDRIAQAQRRYRLFPQVDLMAINGVMIEAGAMSAHSLVDFGAKYAGLKDLIGELSHEQAEYLIRYFMVKLPPCFDVRSKAGGIIWLTDLEKDEAFAEHPKTLRSILRHSNTGFFDIRRNLVTSVIALDITAVGAAGIFKSLRESWIGKGAPIRFGLLLTNTKEKDMAAVLIRTSYGIAAEHGSIVALELIEKYLDGAQGKDEVDDDFMEKIYESVVPSGRSSTAEAIADKDESRAAYKESREISSRMLLTSETCIFTNGKLLPVPSTATFDEAMVEAYTKEIGELQQLVFQNYLKDDVEDIYGHLLETRHALSHRHPALFPSNSHELVPSFVDLSRLPEAHLKELLNDEKYLYTEANHKKSQGFKAAKDTLWVVLDINRPFETALLKETMKFLAKTKQTCRLRFLFTNPPERNMKTVLVTYREMLKGAMAYEKYGEFLERSIDLRQASTDHLKKPGKRQGGKSADWEMCMEMAGFVQAVMVAAGQGPKYKQPLIFVNGRLAAKVDADGPAFTADHFEVLLEYESRRTSRIIGKIGEDHADLAGLVLKASVFGMGSLMALQSSFGTGQYDIAAFPVGIPELPTFKLGKSRALVHVQAILDPLSISGQRYATIIHSMANVGWLSAETWLNPMVKLAHFPLPTFYRQTQPNTATLQFDMEGTFALQLDPPAAWDCVLASGSDHPDSLSGAKATVRMKVRSLVVEAKLEVLNDGRRPDLAGLLLLAKDRLDGTVIERVPLMGDINAAIFHKLTDKLFTLELEDQTSYQMEPLSNFDMKLGRNLKYVPVHSTRIPLKRDASVKPVGSTSHASINVFSIASGPDYERLIRIMMTSVTKKAGPKETIKFWLIDNFVTEEFRQSLQALSKHYGFAYELVGHRWPVWLRKQMKKHRTVWAYKILFLDQLFPTDLDRVIYVDADQVVRADLGELARTELKEGAPWAFVPFCQEGRPETDGLRFWKQGYWKGVLDGKPYHISALFLVDLRRLRATGLADRLRRDYHMLSVDPNSLANLDQDLPNHMQDDFPIHSLPQEWLWCETWCSDASKARAKSIDLCSWPGRGESKLEQGKRIIPEWKEYDHEVSFILDNQQQAKGKQRSKSEL